MNSKQSEKDFLVKLEDSNKTLHDSMRVNIYTTIVLVFIGLVGHILTILVYSKKKYRINSGNVYILCLAIVDGTFLVVHVRLIKMFFLFFKFFYNSYFSKDIRGHYTNNKGSFNLF